MRYRVNDIYDSIQGEGLQTGVPMVVLRLHGCAVGCPWCDTRESWHIDPANKVDELEKALGRNELWAEVHAAELADFISHNYPTFLWVLVTGGEPADQELEELVDALHDAGFNCAIETSGTADGHLLAAFDHVCVSPKIAMPGGKRIVPEVVREADEIKHVVGKQEDVRQLMELLAACKVNKHKTAVCLQPVSLSKKATDLCVAACKQYGWRLSVQVHKYLELP